MTDALGTTRDSAFSVDRFICRYFTEPGELAYHTCQWKSAIAEVGSFKQEGVEFPSFWSQQAINITTSKYFRGNLGDPERETSLKDIVDRVADTIVSWGLQYGQLADQDEAEDFREELKYILIHQYATFNSPVGFNIGHP